MPRYYFHVHNDIDAPDAEGTELPDLAAARVAAIQGVRELAAETVMEGRLHLDHFVEVTDETGVGKLKVTFGEAIVITGQPA
jgi:hypothetical protein